MRCFFSIVAVMFVEIFYAQKAENFHWEHHYIDKKFCKSSFQTIYIGNKNLEENVKQHLLKAVKNLRKENVSVQLENHIESPAGFHFSYYQYYRGIKIFRSQIKVNADKKGNIKSVFDNTIEVLENSPGFFENSFTQIKIDAHNFKKEFVYFPNEKKLIPSLRFEALKEDDYFEVIFDSEGKIIYQNKLARYFSDSTVAVKIFLPDPLTTAGVTYGTPYKDNNDNDVNELNSQRVDSITNAFYDSVASIFRLENSFVKITEHSSPTVQPVTSSTPDFSFSRSQDGFEDVNVFFHITNFHSYIQNLGFNNLVNYQLNADAHALSGQDNSSFIAFPTPRLNFGEGGVDDAEDADVIIHEYSHAVSDDAAPGTNFGTERNALDEALGDYFASSYSRNINSFKWENVFSWDGHNEFWNGRMSVTSDHYPDDLQNNLYDDADIWSATMMEIWEDIGKENTDALQLQALYGYASNMKMSDAALLVIQADSALNNGAYYYSICNRFYDRGLINFCEVGIDEFQTTTKNKFVQLLNSENFSSENVILKFLNKEKSTIQLFDVTGKLVFKKEIFTDEFILHGENLLQGIYLLNVQSENFSENFKLVK